MGPTFFLMNWKRECDFSVFFVVVFVFFALERIAAPGSDIIVLFFTLLVTMKKVLFEYLFDLLSFKIV